MTFQSCQKLKFYKHMDLELSYLQSLAVNVRLIEISVMVDAEKRRKYQSALQPIFVSPSFVKPLFPEATHSVDFINSKDMLEEYLKTKFP